MMTAPQPLQLMAFYFPQFYPIEQNSRWWGEGFTDWQLVRTAKPLMSGHYQPRQPLQGNYYDQSNPATIDWQVQLAEHYGLHGFNFYHYWFDGQLLLEKPLELFRAHPQHNLNYCITWANETWTRQWVGDPEVLMAQHYGADRARWQQHFAYVCEFFHDPRYKKINNCPIFCLYRPELHPHLQDWMACWHELACQQGFAGIHWLAIRSYPLANDQALYRHFNGVINFAPRWFFNQQKAARSPLWRRLQPLLRQLPESWQLALTRLKQNNAGPTTFAYADLWQAILEDARQAPAGVLPSVAVDWDNTARYGARSHFLRGADPAVFADQLTKLVEIEQRKGNSLIFINAWNEWSEGAYLEPDERNGYAYLEALAQVVAGSHDHGAG